MENEAVFGEAAANALHHNFYVDDLLKSIEDLDSAKRLVKDVINMCKSGGFYLTKFIFNNKELLLTVPENQKNGSKRSRFVWRFTKCESIGNLLEFNRRHFLF